MIRLANQVVTEVRQRTPQDVCGHRGRKRDPLYDIRRLLLVLARNGSATPPAVVSTRPWRIPMVTACDEVASAWVAKEHFSAKSTRPRISKPLAGGWKHPRLGRDS